MTLPDTGRFDLKISTVTHMSARVQEREDWQLSYTGELTPCNYVENKNDKTQNTASSASLPRFGALNGDRCSLHKEEHGQLEEGGESVVEHLYGDLAVDSGVCEVFGFVAKVVREKWCCRDCLVLGGGGSLGHLRHC